tara:strand:- start:14282 stop:14593 length:312 start_codon:yes stop_codon:yes gene_type:complete
MTDNQRFNAFQKRIRKMRFGHHEPIPFPTKIKVHVWTDRDNDNKPKLIEFTMQPGMKAVDASKMADALTKPQFGLTRKEMEYTLTHCSQLDIYCQSTGKKLKV